MLKAIGSSINENTLFGLVLVLGMVVDDAIVVIENVYRYLQMGYKRSDAVITGTQEVLSPVLTSTLTTIAAFMPLVLLPGTIGEFLKVVPITVSLALRVSRRVLSHPTFSHCRLWGRPAKKPARRDDRTFNGALHSTRIKYSSLLAALCRGHRRSRGDPRFCGHRVSPVTASAL